MNKQVAVTGAGGGIGQAIVDNLAGHGLSVWGLDVAAPPAGKEGVRWLSVDVTEPASVHGAVKAIYGSTEGPVDLVCCAGIVEDDVPAEEMPIDIFDKIISVNLRGLFLCCQAFGRELLARGGGSIVNIASMSGNYVVNHPQHQCAYNSSKAAVTALTKSLAVEWGPRGVRLNAVSPGYIKTPLVAAKAHQFHHWMPGIVAGRFGEPAEVAQAVAFLLSTGANYCYGTELLMDGGFSLR